MARPPTCPYVRADSTARNWASRLVSCRMGSPPRAWPLVTVPLRWSRETMNAMIGPMSTAGLDAATKRMVLVACILGTTVVTVDSTAINVALPAIAEELGGGLAGQQWTANAYLLTPSSLPMIGGSLGDMIGGRRVFVAGVARLGGTAPSFPAGA